MQVIALIRSEPRAPAPVAGRILGPLRQLPGTWTGHGLSVITRAGVPGEPPVVTEASPTMDTLAFAAVDLANAASAGRDHTGALAGVQYVQQIVDDRTSRPLSSRTGVWLSVERGPSDGEEVLSWAREAGDILLADGQVSEVPGAAQIPATSVAVLDSLSGRPLTAAGLLAPDQASAPPAGVPDRAMTDPNDALRAHRRAHRHVQKTLHTTVLTISTDGAGMRTSPDSGQETSEPDSGDDAPQTRRGSERAPAEDARRPPRRAALVSLHATYWIERITHPVKRDRESLQLLYSEKITLSREGVLWPQVTVGTLLRHVS